MRSFLPLLSVYCISLLCLQLHALPVRNRLDLKAILHQLRERSAVSPDAESSSDDPTNVPLDKTSLWRALLYKQTPPTSQKSKSTLNPTEKDVKQGFESTPRTPRGRRSAYARGHHHQQGQLMRVGCVLGTCQVQKLSHRLYQLIGQTGREDSAPINPHSPHSYG
ncbi:adrenomedullin 2a precursor [Silurus asotus]|uniref:Adrenomedullin 2a n=1 Tax=Silurus asotus TaxID=30991 RepID=A0AAD5AKI1_SILAS|nr:adrenomedullin 2a precursor [Silurus asotus]